MKNQKEMLADMKGLEVSDGTVNELLDLMKGKGFILIVPQDVQSFKKGKEKGVGVNTRIIIQNLPLEFLMAAHEELREVIGKRAVNEFIKDMAIGRKKGKKK